MRSKIPVRTLPALAAMVLLLGSCSFPPDSWVRWGLSFVPTSVDRTLGEQAVSGMGSAPELEGMAVSSVLLQLDSVLDRDSAWDYTLRAMDDEVVNAFALPGGPIFLHRGLLRRIEAPEALAGLIAHEMGHVQARHGTQGVARAVFWTLLAQAALGDLGGLGQILAQHGTVLAENAYSRDQEREADSLGALRLAEAGIDPAGMASLLEILEEQSHETPGLAALWSTHPLTSERIDNVRRIADRLRAGRTFVPPVPDSTWSAFRAAVGPAKSSSPPAPPSP
jgi:predicted Zn-dependent protease